MVDDSQAHGGTPSPVSASPGGAPGGAPTRAPVHAPDDAPVDAPDDAPGGAATATAGPVEVAVPDGPLGARVAAIPDLALAERPDALEELDAAIVAELRAIEDL